MSNIPAVPRNNRIATPTGAHHYGHVYDISYPGLATHPTHLTSQRLSHKRQKK